MSYNNEVYDEFYNAEFTKIPYIFRFGNLRVKVAIALMVLLCAAFCVLPVILLTMHIPGGLRALLTLAMITASIAGWMVVALAYEKRAARKATAFYFRHQAYETQRAEERLRKWRTDYLKNYRE